MDAAHEKARETARKNRELRKAARAVQWQQEQEDRTLMLAALRDILRDQTASPTQKLFAISVLDYAKSYHLIPMRLMKKADFSTFKEKVEAIQTGHEQTPT